MSESSKKPGTAKQAQAPVKSKEPVEQAPAPQAPGQPFELAVLALQNTTLFPETVVPLAVGRTRSVTAVEAALATPEKLIACITVRPESTAGADATPSELYSVGTLVMIKRMERLDDTMHIIAQGTERIRVLEWKQQEPYLRAVVQILPEPPIVDAEEVEAT